MGEWVTGRQSDRATGRQGDKETGRRVPASPRLRVTRWGRLWLLFIPVLVQIVLPGGSSGAEIWSGGDGRYDVTTTLKWTSLLSHAPEDSVLYPERWSAAALSRMRLTLDARPASWLGAEVSYEHRARVVSENSGGAGGAGILLPEVRAPYRLRQGDEPLVEVGDTFAYRHELDRASLSAHAGQTDVTVGRQAIGWGRGVLFGAVDIFAPFTPLEVDREWRRGVDAVRARVPLGDRIALDVVAALGESSKESAYVGRMHGYVGSLDGEIIFGKRYEDYLVALTASAPVLDAELHGEMALFQVPEPWPEGGAFGQDDLIAKTVIGGSYSVDAGTGLYLVAEHHYSGFGVKDIKNLVPRLLDSEFRARLLRGDTQVLGRHAAVLQATYGIASMTPITLSWILSPVDGSGIIAPSVSWIFSDYLTLLGYVYLPCGAGPDNGKIQSEYGGTPASGLVQISFYF